MKVYGHPMSATTRMTLTMLGEKKANASFVVVDVPGKEHKRSAHLRRQPFGHIPVLEEDDGFELYEVVAILRYLEGRFPTPALAPFDPRDQARLAQWISIGQTELAPAIQQILSAGYAEMMGLEAPPPGTVEKGKELTAHVYEVMADRLSRCEYLAGSDYSWADIFWQCASQHLFDIGLGAMLTDHPTVARWWKRVSARPVYEEIVKQMASQSSTAKT